MRFRNKVKGIIIFLSMCFLAACEPVEDPSLFPEYSDLNNPPPLERTFQAANDNKNVYFGDLHIHTSYSTDAFTMGVRGLPDDAYAFARGEAIAHPLGYPIQIAQPLDFAAVTDHSEYLGVVRASGSPQLLSERPMRQRLIEDGPLMNAVAFYRIATFFHLEDVDARNAEVVVKNTWQKIIEAAERNNDPGRFTAFIAYEWSSAPEYQNLHRNIIYRGNRGPEIPFSSMDSDDPEDLWSALEEQRAAGLDNLAIPHNGNVSNGLMYDRVTLKGEPIGAEYAERRMRNEPISEIFQVKGASETHPSLSPADQFADFDIVNQMLSREKQNSKPAGSYVRDAYKTGLEFEQNQSINPYRFGVIGSSDGHTASSPVDEDRFTGKLPLLDGSAAIRLGEAYLMIGDRNPSSAWGSAGIAAVWSRENTRAALFDAMRNKETYATSGPRIKLRFFAGINFDENILGQTDWIEQAYAKGVPMGGQITATDSSPTFIIAASKDAQGANLDRLQIIKGWIDQAGMTHEKIYDVVLSPNRNPSGHSLVANDVGNTVDVADASYTNTIGSPQLSATWRDPDYVASQNAFYYARAIEIPTPKWSTYDAKTLGVPAREPSSHQERAVSSAIWIKPR